MSPNGPPALMLPLPPFISPSLPSPTASLPFSQHYIHMYIPHPLFYSIPIPPFILYAGPAPLPPNFAFLDISWPSPYYQHPPPPLYIHFHCLPRLSISILAHPIPLPLPAPLPSFSLFWVIFGCFIAFIYFSFCIYMYIYDY